MNELLNYRYVYSYTTENIVFNVQIKHRRKLTVISAVLLQR